MVYFDKILKKCARAQNQFGYSSKNTEMNSNNMRVRLFRNYGWSCVAVFLGGFSARFFFFEGFFIWEWSVLSFLSGFLQVFFDGYLYHNPPLASLLGFIGLCSV
jgi:hypothetical protein